MDGCLLEANIISILAEALTAEVEVVLADETSTVGADTARECNEHGMVVWRTIHGNPFRKCGGESTRRWSEPFSVRKLLTRVGN